VAFSVRRIETTPASMLIETPPSLHSVIRRGSPQGGIQQLVTMRPPKHQARFCQKARGLPMRVPPNQLCSRVGKSDAFDDALASFAMAYAVRTHKYYVVGVGDQVSENIQNLGFEVVGEVVVTPSLANEILHVDAVAFQQQRASQRRLALGGERLVLVKIRAHGLGIEAFLPEHCLRASAQQTDIRPVRISADHQTVRGPAGYWASAIAIHLGTSHGLLPDLTRFVRAATYMQSARGVLPLGAA